MTSLPSILHLITEPSMRHYLAAWELKQAGFDWRSRLLERWAIDDRTMLVVQLKADLSYVTEEDRVRAFKEKGGGCRQTYFVRAKKFQAAGVPPRIILENPAPDNGWGKLDVSGLLGPRLGRLGTG